MILFSSIDPLFAISGFAVGALVGMTGVGGGSLMTPLLILLFGIHPATAVGTDLLMPPPPRPSAPPFTASAEPSIGASSGGWQWEAFR